MLDVNPMQSNPGVQGQPAARGIQFSGPSEESDGYRYYPNSSVLSTLALNGVKLNPANHELKIQSSYDVSKLPEGLRPETGSDGMYTWTLKGKSEQDTQKIQVRQDPQRPGVFHIRIQSSGDSAKPGLVLRKTETLVIDTNAKTVTLGTSKARQAGIHRQSESE